MTLAHLILPSLATIALGSALLLPQKERKAGEPSRQGEADDESSGSRENPDGESCASRERRDGESCASREPRDESGGSFGQTFEELVAAAETGLSPHERPSFDEPEASETSNMARSSSPVASGADGLRGEHETPEASVVFNDLTIGLPEKADESKVAHHEDIADTLAAQPQALAAERIVPLTRRRLRSKARPVGWPGVVDPARATCGPEERAALLRSIDAATSDVRERALLRALSEEDGELRLMALRSLARLPTASAGDAFAEILIHGADEERAIVIDALLAIDRRDDLVAAFNDRVEAIAAKAVFAYVGSRRREDYIALLERRVERPQREAILALLAGTLE